MKTNNVLKQQLRQNEHIAIPQSVQDLIPVSNIYADGLFQHGDNLWSMCYKFTDVNYRVASEDAQEAFFFKYMELINIFDSKAITKITINNRRVNIKAFKDDICLAMNPADGFDKYREEYNKMLLQKVEESNGIIQEKYLTVSIVKGTIEEARAYFARTSSDFAQRLENLGSICVPVPVDERIRIFYNFFRVGEEPYFFFNKELTDTKGHSFKDYICPDDVELVDDETLKIGNRYARVMFLKDYATYIKDSLVSELTEMNRNLMLSIDVVAIPTDEALKEAENRLLGIETNIAKWQRRQNDSGNFSAEPPIQFKQQKSELENFIEDLTSRDQRMFLSTLTLIHTAESREQLDKDTQSLKDVALSFMCQLSVLKWEQIEGMQTAVPFGVKKIAKERTLTTEALAVFMPFKVQDVIHKGGVYYGQNVISNNIITINKSELKNGNSMILGVPGSGKSFTAKLELISYVLRDPDADIIIVDPESEYGDLVRALGGEVIEMSADSKNHINAMDISSEYGGEGDPVKLKSEYIMSLIEQVITDRGLNPREKSIIDRCTRIVCEDYLKSNGATRMPTLVDLYNTLMRQEEEEAHELALSIEYLTTGSLNTFAKETNVRMDNHLVCFDILALGKQLETVGYLVMLDHVLNRLIANRGRVKKTYIFIDELSVLFKNNYSAMFMDNLWRRARKYGGMCTGITQNVSTMLDNEYGRTMVDNSEFTVMLSQAPTDRVKLSERLQIPDEQMSYVTNSVEGSGLIRFEKSLIPFANNFPKDTELYKLITTKFSDRQAINIQKALSEES